MHSVFGTSVWICLLRENDCYIQVFGVGDCSQDPVRLKIGIETSHGRSGIAR